ncbi:protein kinase domain-containing protein [Thermogemmatispora carboxidivorans]|uniref:protein kinase domain-containing protein n=1 Tax=Thermogemmatispora carboxidivorans TaxID=1382306 RepID=UPI00069ACE98|nr:protein kinase [Thermogemmatispora carboxidivorans]
MKGIEGLTLGRYELRRRIAQGGMAEVYVAYDRRVKRQVAIKVLYGRDESFIRRFEREALAVGALSHDHILPLYDFGEQSPWYYLVMPYVEGGTLRDYLHRRKRLTLEEAASFLDQIASALQYAHDHGVLHRDVKPSNILLRPDGYAYLADFGLAKAIMGAESLTSDGTIVGTPEYMAPEQSNGISDYRSDIYSLGVVLFQMLTGRVPFTAESPVAIFLRHIQTPPPSPREFNSEIPPAVEEVIFKALAKDPNERFQEAQELAAAYWRALQQERGRSPRSRPGPLTLKDQNVATATPGNDDSTLIAEENQAEATPSPSRLAEQETFIVPDEEREMVRPPATPQLFPLTDLPERPELDSQIEESDRENASAAHPPQEVVASESTLLAASTTIRRLPSRRFRLLSLIAACLLLALLLVPLVSLWRGSPSAGKGTSPSGSPLSPQQLQATQTAIAQNNSMATQLARSRAQATAGISSSVGAGNLLYQYDLRSPGGGWASSGSQCFFSAQGYHVQTLGPHEAAWCFSSQEHMTDAVIKVQARLLRGDFCGLVFRLDPTTPSFYVFEINSQGQYRFVRATGTNPQAWLTLIDWTHSNAIQTGYNVPNMLMVLAHGSSFRFYINNQLVINSYSDSAYSEGLIGLLVGGDSNSGSEAVFSDIWVFEYRN